MSVSFLDMETKQLLRMDVGDKDDDAECHNSAFLPAAAGTKHPAAMISTAAIGPSPFSLPVQKPNPKV